MNSKAKLKTSKRRPASKPRGRRIKKLVPPRTAEQYLAKTSRFQDLWDRVVGVISKLRSQDTSLHQASRAIGVSPRTVIRWAGSALRKRKSGHYQAKKSDRLLRMLMVPGNQGAREIAVRDSRQASALGEYWNAVHRYLSTGDSSRIKRFEGKKITDAQGKQVVLFTDIRELDRLGSAGVLSFESLYGRTA